MDAANETIGMPTWWCHSHVVQDVWWRNSNQSDDPPPIAEARRAYPGVIVLLQPERRHCGICEQLGRTSSRTLDAVAIYLSFTYAKRKPLYAVSREQNQRPAKHSLPAFVAHRLGDRALDGPAAVSVDVIE